ESQLKYIERLEAEAFQRVGHLQRALLVADLATNEFDHAICHIDHRKVFLEVDPPRYEAAFVLVCSSAAIRFLSSPNSVTKVRARARYLIGSNARLRGSAG